MFDGDTIFDLLCRDFVLHRRDDMEIINQNEKNMKGLIRFDDSTTFPDKVIFNGLNTVLVYGDDKIVLHMHKDDKYDPTYAFLYGYFLHNANVSKTQGASILDSIREIAPGEKNVEEKKIEKIIDKNLNIDDFVSEMKKTVNK